MIHENSKKQSQHVEPGWNLQEGYHMDNLIQKILQRLTPKEQHPREAELAHTAKKATSRAAGGLIPRTTATAS